MPVPGAGCPALAITLAAVQRFQRALRLPAGWLAGAPWGALVSNGRQRSRAPAC